MNKNTPGTKFAFLIFTFAALSAASLSAQSDGGYYMERGKAKAQKGELAEAIENFTIVIGLTPSNEDAHNARGIAYEKYGDYAAAHADYMQVLRINPGNAEALHNYRNLEIKLRAKGISLPGQTNASAKSRAYTLNTTAPAAQSQRTSSSQANRNTYTSAPRTNPPVKNTTVNTANQTLRGSQTKTAATITGQPYRIPSIPPDGNVFHQTLSQTLPNQKSGQNSKEYYNYDYAPVLSRNQLQTLNTSAATTRRATRGALNQQTFVDPVAESYNLQGTTLNIYGRFNEAVLQFNEAIKSYPEYAIAYNNRGVAFANMGDFASAAADFNQALRLNPYYRDAQFNRERVNNWVAQR